MSPHPRKLHIVFLPFMSPGHTIPMLDMIGVFATRDHIKSTVITTPVNAPTIAKSFDNSILGANSSIDFHIIPFPSKEADLPEGMENVNKDTPLNLSLKFADSTKLLRSPIQQFMEESKPDCLVADLYFSFATELAAKFGIPRLVFCGIGMFASCVNDIVDEYELYKSVLLDDEPFIIPTLPHSVTLTKSQIPPHVADKGSFLTDCCDAALNSYGEVFNSFFELEPDYFNYYRNVLKKRAWHIGPVSLTKRKIKETNFRGMTPFMNEHECLQWLDSKENNSVIYICFGSTTNFVGAQHKEIAMALESSGVQFIWVVNKRKEDDEEELFLDGFGERMEGKGLVVRGWAPQVSILEHPAVGGFVTHCGWNSTLEAVCAGVPMVTWPIFAEQFYNEKLVTDILKIGVQGGSKQWSIMCKGTFVKAEQIEVAMKAVMEGDEAVAMRNRAKKLKELAREAFEEGGSSYCDVSSLIQELRSSKGNRTSTSSS